MSVLSVASGAIYPGEGDLGRRLRSTESEPGEVAADALPLFSPPGGVALSPVTGSLRTTREVGAQGRAPASGCPLSRERREAMTMAVSGPIRVVVAKPGLDGHDRGAKVIARALRDAGVEVIYTGLHQTPEQIVDTAIQEDVDGIGLSVLSGAHMTLFARVITLLRERQAEDITVFGGGIIPDADIPELAALGVAAVFTPGTPTRDVVAWVESHLGTDAARQEAASPAGG